MSTKHIEALKLALEGAANYIDAFGGDSRKYRQALAEQPAQQEPVAWIDEYGNAFPLAAKQYSIVGKHWKPLYTSPLASKPWVGLTDEEIDAIYSSNGGTRTRRQIYQAIEAKLKEKNT